MSLYNENKDNSEINIFGKLDELYPYQLELLLSNNAKELSNIQNEKHFDLIMLLEATDMYKLSHLLSDNAIALYKDGKGTLGDLIAYDESVVKILTSDKAIDLYKSGFKVKEIAEVLIEELQNSGIDTKNSSGSFEDKLDTVGEILKENKIKNQKSSEIKDGNNTKSNKLDPENFRRSGSTIDEIIENGSGKRKLKNNNSIGK